LRIPIDEKPLANALELPHATSPPVEPVNVTAINSII
jgi:hypothetical protein